ncbi:MAG TPA: wax ester/triacylglycerol synthase family O-acyltransferase [Myxococcota bacterium]|jgi:WS/DGAT/MGAT family acyltransferase|nr:wax ester/triacylglycerol synthase family O-acyltransferase [Myxococcota bacterium]
MTSRDAGFLYLERDHALLHIGCVALIGGRLGRDALAARVHARLPRLRRYAQRAVPVPFSLGHPTWEDDPGFDARDHLHRWALPAPGGEGELAELVGNLLARPLDRGRPLWEMHLIEGLDGGRSALFQKVHHCMIDGVSGAQLLEVLLDAEPGVRDVEKPRLVAPPVPRPAARMGHAVLDAARRQAAGVASLLRRPAEAREAVGRLRSAAWSALQLATNDVPEMPWNAPIGAGRALAFMRFPLSGLKRVRAARGGTVNDVVLCVLAGGLHRYLRANGIATRGLELTALVPVSLRTAEETLTLGNRISAMLVPLAVDPASEVPRLAATRAVTERLKTGGAWMGIDALLGALDELPAPLVATIGRSLRLGRLANVIATNVQGPREARWLCGRKVEALHPIVPIVDGIGLGLAVFSYDGMLHVGLNAEPTLVPDLGKLSQSIEESFSELVAGA